MFINRQCSVGVIEWFKNNSYKLGFVGEFEIWLKRKASPWWGSCHRKVTDEGKQKKVNSNINLKIVQTIENADF